MSATVQVPAFTTSSGGDVSIWVGSQQISGWESVEITKSAEGYPNNFRLTLADVYASDQASVTVKPGVACEVYIGTDLVITGRIDRFSASISPGRHDIEIVGRGLGAVLVDCSADLVNPDSPVKGGSISASSALDLAQKLAKSFGVFVRNATSDNGKPIMTFQVALGETPFEVIERVCRYAGFLIYEDEFGNMVLDRVGTQAMASGFQQGVNVEAASSSWSVDQRFSDYYVVYSTVGQSEQGTGYDITNQRAHVVDTAMVNDLKLFRPRVIVSTQTDQSLDFADRMANWEMARRIGRSQAVQITCDSWRDSAGKLWQPNRLAQVDIPALKLVGAQWIIGSVTLRKDQSGTHSDLVLMPPDAFAVQPSTLVMFDNEMYNSVNSKPTGAS